MNSPDHNDIENLLNKIKDVQSRINKEERRVAISFIVLLAIGIALLWLAFFLITG